MKTTTLEIKKEATLRVTRSLSGKFEDVSLEINVIAEIEVNDKKVIINSESTVYNLVGKDELRTEIEGTLEGLIQRVKEKATKLIDVIITIQEICKSKGIELNVIVD